MLKIPFPKASVLKIFHSKMPPDLPPFLSEGDRLQWSVSQDPLEL